jgi:hypothetical protein
LLSGCRAEKLEYVTAPVVLAALLFWGAVFTSIFVSQGMSPLEFFFGRYEPPPGDLGIWKETGTEQPSGLLREERLLLPRGNPKARCLLRQVRYRDPVTHAIARVEAEQQLPRRRVSARG